MGPRYDQGKIRQLHVTKRSLDPTTILLSLRYENEFIQLPLSFFAFSFQKNKQIEEQEEDKLKKRKGAELELKKPTKKVKKTEPEKQLFKYIHEQYTQEQLLAEAAHTEYFNLISLRRLISLEEEKKVYEHKEHTLDPPKIVYRDSNRGGNREQTITLVGYPPETNLFDIKE